jgi:EAL domain-containing protein (putative c-di-GMP-specific phosphodiesterase class I)
VRAVVALGNSLGMVTCAEGVETGEQLSYLRSEGCVEMQGFYYSKPKPLADVVTMMRATHAKLAIPLQPVDFEEYGLTTDIRLPAA